MKTVVEMAREAGLIVDANQSGFDSVQTFAELVTEQANARANTSWALMCKKMVAAENEACAKVVEDLRGQCWAYDHDQIATAIRTRGNT